MRVDGQCDEVRNASHPSGHEEDLRMNSLRMHARPIRYRTGRMRIKFGDTMAKFFREHRTHLSTFDKVIAKK